MLEKLKDRNNQIILSFIVIFMILFIRLSNLTIVEGEDRRAKSEEIRKQSIPIVAPRGEIRDRNGLLIAGNTISFTVQLIRSEVPQKEFEEVAIKIIDILEKNNEAHIEFPIVIEDGKFLYSHDQEIENWLKSLGEGYENLKDAEAVFNKIASDNLPIENLEKTKAQEYLIAMGITPPISISKMKFLPQIHKENFLKSYNLDIETSAEKAFQSIKEKHKISSDEYSDEDARKILIIRHAIKEQGHLQFNPLKIASDISQKTAILIEEKGMNLPGISVAREPRRYYPEGELAAHILGYLGKISRESEIKKYVKENGYSRSDIIGKTGIEKTYELALKGENGIKTVEVNAYGRTIREFEYVKKPKPGEAVYLTIDKNLQKVSEEALKHALEEIQKGGSFKSKWGDYDYRDSFENAKSGAVVTVDVNTGEVLAMASYPAYDPNLFATGISHKDWNSLRPKNKRDPIAPRPLYNIATMTAVQPGSIFKMITGLAAVEQGLDPNRKLRDGGVIVRGSRTFGCWLWNKNRGNHGYVDLVKAIEHSCNYYMYNVVHGYDYYKNEPLGIDMNVEKLIDYVKKFGLGEESGLEIREASFGAPDTNKKAREMKASLRRQLNNISEDYFKEEILNDEEKLKNSLDKIVSWAEENPSRGTIIKRLEDLGVKESEIEALADIVKFDYYNQTKFGEGDGFNLAIGQGSNAYTPVQIVRYIAAIANGGYLNELTLIKQVGSEEKSKEDKRQKIDLNNDKNLEYIKEGMRRANVTGTSSAAFNGFEGVAGKTGTAQREGKIPPIDEIAYLKQYLKYIAPQLSLNIITDESSRIFKQRKKELAELQSELEGFQDILAELEGQYGEAKNEERKNQLQSDIEKIKDKKTRVNNKIIGRLRSGYFNEGSIMREAIKGLTDNRVTDKTIDQHKKDYDNFAWFVSFAPCEKPEIAVVVLLFQGGKGGYGAPVAKEIIGTYLEAKNGDAVENVEDLVE